MYPSSTSEACSTFIGWVIHSKFSGNENIKNEMAEKQEENWTQYLIFLDYLDFITQKDFMMLVNKGSNLDQVKEFIHFLSHSTFERWDMPIDNLWRKLLSIIDETQRDLTLKELLESEERASRDMQEDCKSAWGQLPPKSQKRHRKSNSSYHSKSVYKGLIDF